MGGRSVANAHGDLLVWLDGMKQQRVTESYTSIAHTKKNAIFVCVCVVRQRGLGVSTVVRYILNEIWVFTLILSIEIV